jgi:hypothetical protein
MRINNIVFGAMAILTMSGCSTMLPYDSEFTCKKGNGKGMCGSMSEIYDETLKNNDSNESSSGQTVSAKEHYIGAPNENEEVIYALYRKEKDSHVKNVQQDERLAALEMQAKLLIANNSNLSGKFAELQNQKAPIADYPVFSGANSATESVISTSEKKKSKKKKSHKKRIKKILVPAEKPEEFIEALGVAEVTYKDSFARAAPNLLRPTVAEPIHKGERFSYTGESKSWYRLKSGLYVSKKVVKKIEENSLQPKVVPPKPPVIKAVPVKTEAKR